MTHPLSNYPHLLTRRSRPLPRQVLEMPLSRRVTKISLPRTVLGTDNFITPALNRMLSLPRPHHRVLSRTPQVDLHQLLSQMNKLEP